MSGLIPCYLAPPSSSSLRHCRLPAPAAAQDAADFVVRLNRLENQVRQMSGQIEQLQFENRQLKDQLRKFQEDMEFRFQESAAGAAGLPACASPPAAAPPPIASQTPAMQPPRAPRRGDAFDPGAAPHAPGAPMPLGTTRPSAPLPPNVVAEVAPGPAGRSRAARSSRDRRSRP